MDRRIWFATACVTALLGCAGGSASRPVSARPSRVAGETVRGPAPGAQSVEAEPEPGFEKDHTYTQ